MQRDIGRLLREEFDVVVVGGGIYGACTAREAARCGLRVALVEAGDFGHATSSNSLRTLHGGLRHLQRLDLRRMRESIRARREWLRLAPQLVKPLRFVLPTFGHGLKGPEAMRAALCVNDLVSFDRNRGVDATRVLGASAVWSKRLARAILTGTRTERCNGAATWFDGVCSNTERLLFAVVAAAVGDGTCAANYVCATGLTVQGGSVTGVRARDELNGLEFAVRTRCVINAAGPWVGDWMGLPSTRPPYCASKAFNLLTRPLPFKEAMGFPVPRHDGSGGPQTYFVLPWNGRALVGTRHLRCDPGARAATVTRDEVVDFLEDLNPVLGRCRIAGSDVLGVYAGLLPEKSGHDGPDVELERSPQVIDHGDDGAPGVFSVVGVKWTNSWPVAARLVRCTCRFLRHRPSGRGSAAVLWGPGGSTDAGARRRWRLEADSIAHLEELYGPQRSAVFALLDEDESLCARVVPDLPVIKAQIVHAARAEMALQLADIVLRRTPLYMSESLDTSTVRECAALAARELRWSRREVVSQIASVESLVQQFRGPLSPQPPVPTAVTEWIAQPMSSS